MKPQNARRILKELSDLRADVDSLRCVVEAQGEARKGLQGVKIREILDRLLSGLDFLGKRTDEIAKNTDNIAARLTVVEGIQANVHSLCANLGILDQAVQRLLTEFDAKRFSPRKIKIPEKKPG